MELFNQMVLEAGGNILGPRRRKKEKWISQETWKRIDERKEVKKKIVQAKSERLKQQLRDNYSALDKEMKRHTKRDKIQFIDNLAAEAEAAASKHPMIQQ